MLFRFPLDSWQTALALSLLAASCAPRPPAPPPSVAPTPSAPAPAPAPPPPPKCEDLNEHCAATAETHLAVGESGSWLTPPLGWHYAKSASGSIAMHPDGTAFLWLVPSPEPADVAPAVEALILERGVTGLRVEKLKRRLKKPQQTLPAGAGSVDLWEVDTAQQGAHLALRDKGNGTLLVLVGKPAAERTLLGVGFVVDSVAETEAPKIMHAIQTLRGAP